MKHDKVIIGKFAHNGANMYALNTLAGFAGITLLVTAYIATTLAKMPDSAFRRVRK